MTALPRYPIAAAARMTGLSIDTLRAWERRYGAVAPTRDDRGRLYAPRDVARLKRLAALVADGHAIGRIARLSDEALTRLGADTDASPAAPSSEFADLDPLRRALDQYDIGAIELILSRHSLVLPPHELLFGVVLPLLRDIGSRWAAGSICTAHEHVIASAVRNVLGAQLRAQAGGSRRSRMVFATPAGQRHELGLLCAAVLAAWAGHSVLYLGPDLPAGDIADAVIDSKATTLVIASTIADPAGAAAVRELKQLPKSVAIVVGGPHAATLRSYVGARARAMETLEEFRRFME